MNDVRAHSSTVVLGPASYPITQANAMAFSGVIDPALADQLIASAVYYFQHKTCHQLCEVTYSQNWDGFPCQFNLDWSPVQSVTWVKYRDLNGVQQTLDASQYWSSLNASPPRIIPAYGVVWPETQLGRPESVEVRYVAGYDDYAAIESGILRGLYGLISLWSKLPEPVVWNGGIPKDIPHSLNALMGLYSRKGYA